MGQKLSLCEYKPPPGEEVSRNRFDFIRVIGRGGFGKVWHVQDKKNLKEYAMKEIKKVKVIDKKSEISVRYERELLSKLTHPFIVNMHYSFQDYHNLYLVMDLLKGGDLRYHITKNQTFSENQTKFFLACIILALEYIHSKKVIHRDIKPENLVLDEKGYARVTDFGIAKVLNLENAYETSGTPGYMSPEVIEGLNHTQAVDYYALGIIGYEFMTGRRPFYGKTRKEMKDSMLHHQLLLKNPDIPKGWSPEAINFINKLLIRRPEDRLGYQGINELKEHTWFSQFSWDDLNEKNIKSPFIPNGKDNFDKKYCQAIDKVGLVTRQRYDNYFKNPKFELIFENFTYYNNVMNKKADISYLSWLAQNEMNTIHEFDNYKSVEYENYIKTDFGNKKRTHCIIQFNSSHGNSINLNSTFGNTINVNSAHGNTINVNNGQGNTINVNNAHGNTINVNDDSSINKSNSPKYKGNISYRFPSAYNYSLKLIESKKNKQKIWKQSQKRNISNNSLIKSTTNMGLQDSKIVNSNRSKTSLPKQYPNEYLDNDLSKKKIQFDQRSISNLKESYSQKEHNKKNEVPLQKMSQTKSIAEKIRIIERSKSNFGSILVKNPKKREEISYINQAKNPVSQTKGVGPSSSKDKKAPTPSKEKKAITPTSQEKKKFSHFQHEKRLMTPKIQEKKKSQIQPEKFTKSVTPIFLDKKKIFQFLPEQQIMTPTLSNQKSVPINPEKKGRTPTSQEKAGISLDKYKNIKLMLIKTPKKPSSLKKSNMSSKSTLPSNSRYNKEIIN